MTGLDQTNYVSMSTKPNTYYVYQLLYTQNVLENTFISMQLFYRQSSESTENLHKNYT
jgi:hypothetical protein